MADIQQPKKAPSAYWLYLEDHRAEIVKEIGTAKPPEVSKKAGERWKAISEEDRKPYEEKAAKKKEEYQAALQEFKESGGVVSRKSKKVKLLKGKKAKKDPNEPKRPAGGAYGVYLSQHREEIRNGLPADRNGITDVAKVAGARFKALSEVERSDYEDRFAVKKEEYQKAFEEWKATRKEAEAEEQDAKAASPPAKRTSGKRGMEKSSEKKEPKAKRGRPSKPNAAKDCPIIEEDVIAEAKKLQMEGPLKNLAARSEIAALNLPGKKILSALQASNGLVNAAKHALLGA